jgi:hypothetical protein
VIFWWIGSHANVQARGRIYCLNLCLLCSECWKYSLPKRYWLEKHYNSLTEITDKLWGVLSTDYGNARVSRIFSEFFSRTEGLPREPKINLKNIVDHYLDTKFEHRTLTTVKGASNQLWKLNFLRGK